MGDKSELAELGLNNDSTLTNHQTTTERKNIVYKQGFFFKKRLNWSDMSDREITCNQGLLELPDNHISTSKYTLVSFIPKNLFLQFAKLANLYFLFIGVMQCILIISISSGKPVIYVPLSAIVAITAVKDLFEDLKRHKSDNEENNRKVSVNRNGGFMETTWKDLKVGEVIKLKKNEFFPADVVILSTSEPKGACYIETKNLDGETNLKHKMACKELAKCFSDEKSIHKQSFQLSYEKPNPYLYTFCGTVIMQNGNKISCDAQNFVLRGCSLRNTEFIYGLIAYSGHDTKIMLNSVKSRAKQSKLEKAMNKEILVVFVLQFIICFVVAIIYATFYKTHQDEFGYLEIDANGLTDRSTAYNLFVRFGNWILIFTNFVPISLLVTLEMVKFVQGILISKDEKLKCIKENEYVNVQSSNLNEELGQVEYIFSDKTGTLTCNIMEFRMICVNKISFGENTSADISSRPKVTNVNFKDILFFETMADPSNKNYAMTKRCLELLAICHTVIVENKQNEIIYNASSPDELALINFARLAGYEFQGIDENNNILLNVNGAKEKFFLMHTLEFTSARKRMSIIFKDAKGKIFIFSKGADSILLDRMNKSNPNIPDTWKNLEKYAEKGLRTLILCQKEISVPEYEKWAKKYQDASTSIIDREKKMADVQEEIEQNLELVGATAIEDKLQDDVGLTIATLKETGIKVWVLTGDKIETAINIGFSCNLLNNDLTQMIIDGKEEKEILNKIEEKRAQIKDKLKYALIISGDALIHALKPNISLKLMELASICEAVLCCRVSPKQKQEVVTLVREQKPKATTLAIGDGANDVNMITAAHVGIGIKGVEGQQASRAADYAIGEFKFLRRLLLYHGREAYRRNSILICYNFYKNIILVMPQFWFGIFDIFSGQTLYDAYLYQLFNLFYASMPIVIYAVFDEEYSSNFLDQAPEAYKQGIKGVLFTKKIFWIRWLFVSLVQALLIQLFSYFSLCQNFITNDGFSLGFWQAGITAFGQCVLVANIKVFLFSFSHSKLSIFFLIGSYLIYIISFAIVNSMDSSELYQDFKPIFRTSNFHLVNFLIVGIVSGLDLALTLYERFNYLLKNTVKKSNLFFKKGANNHNNNCNNPNLNDDKFVIEDFQNQDQGEELDANLVVRMDKSRHTGFAFSQEENIEMVDMKRFRF